jgi:hypothetical protein
MIKREGGVSNFFSAIGYDIPLNLTVSKLQCGFALLLRPVSQDPL